MAYKLEIGKTIEFDKDARDAHNFSFYSDAVNFTSDDNNKNDWTSINLLSTSGDQLLRLSFSALKGQISLNSRRATDPWKEEVVRTLDGVFGKGGAHIVVEDRKDQYHIYVDGKSVQKFTKRIEMPVKSASYRCTGTSFLSNSLSVSAGSLAQKLELEGKELDLVLEDAGKFIFESNTINLTPEVTAGIDNTNVNLLNTCGDRLLQVSIRRAEGTIVFNSCLSDGTWGREESVKLAGVFGTKGAKIIIEDKGDHYQILSDNGPVYDYSKRIQDHVTRVSYRCNETSVFADVIYVTVSPQIPLTGYEEAYFPLTAERVAKDSAKQEFDLVVIGSGIGGGVLTTDLLTKNQKLAVSQSSFGPASMARIVAPDDESGSDTLNNRPLRILIIERGGLKFSTHSLNMPRPTSRGTYGQMNDMFYNHFKEKWDMDDDTRKMWKGGPVYCLGGRSTVWGLFSPRISDDTFREHFPPNVYTALNEKYLRKAEDTMNLSYPNTLPLHRALMDKLNTREAGSKLPTTQWEWGRIASEFHNAKNFDFAEGAYSTVDRLLEAAMDDPHGRRGFKTLINSQVMRLEPKPVAGSVQPVTHVVISDGISEYKIKCKKAVVCAGAVESAAIMVRSAGDDTLAQAYGPDFVKDFGHVTDHYIFYVTLPFFYRNMAHRDLLGGMKLQTDITFNDIDHTTALANVSIDASSFLPRRSVADGELPQFIIAYILPSALAPQNKVEIVNGKPCIECGYAAEPRLEDKKMVLKNFAASVMNKLASVLDLQFVHHPQRPNTNYTLIPTVTAGDLTLGELGPGGVAHELGSIPMPDPSCHSGIVDENLKMQYGWDNVYVCDLSVFPYSPAANPTLSLAALALRLSDALIPPESAKYQPIIVYNLTAQDVWVTMTLSSHNDEAFNPTERVKIASGESETWKRRDPESISVYACKCSVDFRVQMVQPGVNTTIVEPRPEVPPRVAPACTCS